jgi:hypothetical protein
MIAYTTEGIERAADTLLQRLDAEPGRDLRRVWSALHAGQPPPFAPLALTRDAGRHEDPPFSGRLFIEEALEQNLKQLIRSLDAGNPTAPVVEVGFGPPTLATVFGAEFDPAYDAGYDTPADTIPIEEFDGWSPPPLAEAGLIPRVLEQIEFYKEHTPPEVLIAPPDMQSPYNLAHMLVGPDLREHMTRDPDRVHDLLDLITETLIEAWTDLPRRIGMRRLAPTPGLSFCMAATEARCFVSECYSTELSVEQYRGFVVPYLRRLEQLFGPLAFHPCSHGTVFRELVRAFPDLRYIEAGWVQSDLDDSIATEDALSLLDDGVILDVREHLKPGREQNRLEALIALCRKRPRTYLNLRAPHWTAADDKAIRALHAAMDRLYAES